MITATKNGCPEIGYAGESNACVVSFDCSKYKSKWGEGTPTVMLQRPRERDFYAVGSQEVVDDTVEWTVAREDSMLPGIARVDIWWKSAEGDILGKSGVYFFKIRYDALNTNDPEAPKPWQSYAEKIVDAADKVINVELADVKESIETLEKTKADDTEVKALIAKNTEAIDTINGEGLGSIQKAVTDGIAKVVADAPEDFDTLKEMSDWISSHSDDAAAMNSKIESNSEKIKYLQSCGVKVYGYFYKTESDGTHLDDIITLFNSGEPIGIIGSNISYNLPDNITHSDAYFVPPLLVVSGESHYDPDEGVEYFNFVAYDARGRIYDGNVWDGELNTFGPSDQGEYLDRIVICDYLYSDENNKNTVYGNLSVNEKATASYNMPVSGKICVCTNTEIQGSIAEYTTNFEIGKQAIFIPYTNGGGSSVNDGTFSGFGVDCNGVCFSFDIRVLYRAEDRYIRLSAVSTENVEIFDPEDLFESDEALIAFLEDIDSPETVFGLLRTAKALHKQPVSVYTLFFLCECMFENHTWNVRSMYNPDDLTHSLVYNLVNDLYYGMPIKIRSVASETHSGIKVRVTETPQLAYPILSSIYYKTSDGINDDGSEYCYFTVQGYDAVAQAVILDIAYIKDVSGNIEVTIDIKGMEDTMTATKTYVDNAIKDALTVDSEEAAE